MKVNWQYSICNEDYFIKLVWFSIDLLNTMPLQQKLLADVLHAWWLWWPALFPQVSHGDSISLSSEQGNKKTQEPQTLQCTHDIFT